MQIFVSTYGASVGKKSERLVVKDKGQVVGEYPFHDLEHVMVDSLGISISTDAILECMEHGVPISFMTPGGNPYAKLIPPSLTGTVATRREQLFAFRDHRGIELAKCFIEGKLANQINTIKYFSKYRKSANPAEYEQIVHLLTAMEETGKTLRPMKGNCIDDIRGMLMSVEGRVGNIYWECVKILTANKVEFSGREHRGAQDPVNSMLNYGYAILAHQVETSLNLAGLDPFGGFLHVDRPGKKSLVYDFIEEFRQVVVDRTVIAWVNKGTAVGMTDGMLDVDTRRNLAGKITERLEATERFQGKKYRIKTIIQMQARRIATYLRGEAKYKSFVCGW